jgi:hypothetical protein
MGDINLKAALGGQIVLTPTNTASNYTATFPAVTGVVSVQASASYTTGSVLFVNSSGQIAQDNANFFWDDTNNRLGIGTATPSYALDVNGTINSSSGVIRVAGNINPYLVLNDGTYNAYLQITNAVFNAYTASIPMTFSPGGSEKMRLTSDGNLNIGTSGVAAQLYVAKNSASAISALTDASTIAVDMSLANNFSVTLGGNRTLGNPTNLTAGQSGVIFITQDGTGGRTLAYSSYWDFPGAITPVLTTTAGAVDVLIYTVRTSTSIAVNSILNIG